MLPKMTSRRHSRSAFVFPSVLPAALMLLAGYVQAETPPAVQALEAQGLTIVEEFEVSGDLRAFAGVANGEPMAVYVTNDGMAIVGTRLDASGRPLDVTKLQDLVTRPLDEKTWTQLADTTWVLDGDANAPRVVYVFADPNCTYCNRFWETARPWVETGKVQLRHILVGIIKADSPAKAVAILGAPDPSAALLENERNFGQGGIAPSAIVPANLSRVLDDHRRLMLSAGFQGTPGIVVRDGDSSIKKFNGMPQPGELIEVLGPR